MNHFPSVYVRFRFSTYPVIHYFSMLDLDLALTLLSTISLCQLALSRYPVFSFTCIEYFSMLDVCLAQHPFTFTWYTKIEDIQYLHLPSIFNYKYLVIFHIHTLNTSTIPPTYPYQHTYHHSYKKKTNILWKQLFTYYSITISLHHHSIHTHLYSIHLLSYLAIPILSHYLTHSSINHYSTIFYSHLHHTYHHSTLPHSHSIPSKTYIHISNESILYKYTIFSIPYLFSFIYLSILLTPTIYITYLHSTTTSISNTYLHRHTHTHTDIHIHTQTDTYTTHSYEKIIHLFIYIYKYYLLFYIHP